MAWPPSTPTPQMEGAGNMAGFGARRMQEEQYREAERQQQEWERAEAERRHAEFLQQQEFDRQTIELEKQRLAWEWSELQRQQHEHEERKVRFQQEQEYVAEQQWLQYEQEQHRLHQQQQQQFFEQQQRLGEQQEALQRQQKELQRQQQAHNESITEQQRKLKKAEVELQRKLRSQAAEAQRLREELQQQKQLAQTQLQAQLQRQYEEERKQRQLQQQQEEEHKQRQHAVMDDPDAGDVTLQAITASPAPEEVNRFQPPPSPPKKSPRPRQISLLTTKLSGQRTQAWAAEHAETKLAWCGDCRQDVLLTQLDMHVCMRRNHSNNSSQESARTTDLVRPFGLSANARTPSPSIQPRSPFFDRHLELERTLGTVKSPLSPALSPIWPGFQNKTRSNSNEGPMIRRTPSEDERERLISTPSPIPPDLSPEEEAAIRMERKRRIEAQREAKKKNTTVEAATAIMAALKFENLARAAGPPRSSSPPPMSATVRADSNNRMPHDKFPSNSSLASTQASSLLSASASASPYQRDRAYSGSSAVMTPSTSYAFSAGATSSPDLVPSSGGARMRKTSTASQNVGPGHSGGGVSTGSGLRPRMDSVGAARPGRSRLDSDPAARSQLYVDTTLATASAVPQVAGRKRLDSGKRLELNQLSPLKLPSSASIVLQTDDRIVSSPIEQTRSLGASPIKPSKSKVGNSGNRLPSSASLEPTSASQFPARSRSNSLAPITMRRPSMDNRLPPRSGTSAGTGKVDLRGIEDLMRGLDTEDVVPRSKADAQRRRELSNGAKSPQKALVGAVAAFGSEQRSPVLKARSGGTTPRPSLPSLKTSDRTRS
ncbi:hypothetical protein CF319_g8271 [Tilletia indica]|nr:hypothetical protein CF319_g8271 [Tilletia indica]